MVTNLSSVHMVEKCYALALDEAGRWMGKPLRHVVSNMGPIHLVDVSIQLQKGSVWRLLFHLVGAAGGCWSSHGMKGPGEKFLTIKGTRHLYQNEPRARLNI